MKQQMKTLDGNARDSWNNVIDRYNNDYASLKELYEKEKETAQRKDLFGSAYDNANVCILYILHLCHSVSFYVFPLGVCIAILRFYGLCSDVIPLYS